MPAVTEDVEREHGAFSANPLPLLDSQLKGFILESSGEVGGGSLIGMTRTFHD